jgi:hypothetical protein
MQAATAAPEPIYEGERPVGHVGFDSQPGSVNFALLTCSLHGPRFAACMVSTA